MQGQTKNCQNCKQEFIITSSENTLYQKVGLNIPNICLSCRFAKYFAFWPFGKFRKSVSALSGQSLITMLPVNARYPIYTATEWWSDAWDPMDYGEPYNPSKSFFEQFKTLQEKVPRPHQQGTNSVGSDWCDDVWDSKNCYLSRSIVKAENLSYGYRVVEAKDSFDISHAFNLSNCYECTYSFNSFDLLFSRNCRDCISSEFLYDCRNCSNCMMCSNLRNKHYCIENVQYTKEQYNEKIKEYDMSSHASLEQLKERFNEMLRVNTIHRENFSVNTHNSVGTYLSDCNNCMNVFAWEKSENCTNCLRGREAKDCIDMVGTWKVEVSGNNSCCGGNAGGYALKHSVWSEGRYSEYLDNCLESEYCFGCVGLRKKKYCILNKQYTKEEYDLLRERIVDDMRNSGEYGEMLPYSMGLCAYNFTTAAIYMPEITKEYVLAQGGYWDDTKEDSSEGMPTCDLPDNIQNIDSSISTQALICPETGWRYNISLDEYHFLSRKKIALPRVHFDVRTKRRMQTIAPWRGNDRECIYCDKHIISYYPPEWGYQKVACVECYQKNIN